MRVFFRFAGLLMVLLVLGWLVKTRLSAPDSPHPSQTPTANGPTLTVPSGTPRQIQQEYKDALEQAMQPPARERSEP